MAARYSWFDIGSKPPAGRCRPKLHLNVNSTLLQRLEGFLWHVCMGQDVEDICKTHAVMLTMKETRTRTLPTMYTDLFLSHR